MEEQRLLSDDPNAGRLLSTDPAAGQTSAKPKPRSPMQQMNDEVKIRPGLGAKDLPMIGGMIGGMGGTAFGVGFGSIPGAALGGATGEAAKQLWNRATGQPAPATPTDAVAGIGLEGAKQAALGGVQRAVGGALRMVAPKIMDAGLWRSAQQRIEFPNTPKRLVDEGILPSRAQGALTATEGRIRTTTAAHDAAHPPSVDPAQIASEARQFAHQEGRVGGLGNVPGPEAAELSAAEQAYLAQNTRPRSLGETIDQKRAYQARASYNTRPNAPTATNNELNFNKGVAGANRAEATRIAPSIGDELSREQDLIGAVQANAMAEAKGMPLTIPGAIAQFTLHSPKVMGGAAIAADRVGQFAQNPAMIRAILMELMNGRSGQPGEPQNR